MIAQHGFLFTRCGIVTKYDLTNEGGPGPAYDPKRQPWLLVPTTGASGPNWGFADLLWAVEQASASKIAVLTFHGVSNLDHPWAHTEPRVFASYLQELHERGFTEIALRNLACYMQILIN